MEFRPKLAYLDRPYFPSKEVSYVGYDIYFAVGGTPKGHGYYISHFSGWFVNTSSYYLLQYSEESVNTWHYHEENIYDNYKEWAGEVPDGLTITEIHILMGDPYYSGNTQTAYFDAITIEEEEKPREKKEEKGWISGFETLIAFVAIVLVVIVICLVLIIKRKRKKV